MRQAISRVLAATDEKRLADSQTCEAGESQDEFKRAMAAMFAHVSARDVPALCVCFVPFWFALTMALPEAECDGRW